MGWVRVMVDEDGRLVLPEEIRQSLGIPTGGELLLGVENHELRGSAASPASAMSLREALTELRKIVPPWKPGEPLWSEELIAERRAEAARDLAEEMAAEAERARPAAP
jgi:bifunctional DNA-binding transcriptional regulator/antitoxin component of YhaV-PrlF toxin-antitoxin module